MRYIEKNHDAPIVLEYKKELVSYKLDELNLNDSSNPYVNLTGGELYDMVRDMENFVKLKQYLYEEQGGICCYCGAKLEYPYGAQYRVEHLKPKEKYPRLSGEYKNLLLSCRPSQEEMETRNRTPKKGRKKLMHCDEAKDSDEITYSPLNPDCEKVFSYNLDGSITGIDKAEEDIKILGLGCDYLKRRRSEAIIAWFDDNISSEDLLKCKDAIMSRDKDNQLAEFCFVISNVIEKLLS